MVRDLTKYGSVYSGSSRSLVSELTDPLFAGTVAGFELVQSGPELWSANATIQNHWKITLDGTTQELIKDVDERVFITLPSSGKVTIKAKAFNSNSTAPSGTDVEHIFSTTSNPVEALWRSGNSIAWAVAELTTEAKDYVEAAAAATGANGVTARFLASVLCIEVSNRPKNNRYGEALKVKKDVLERLQWVRRNILEGAAPPRISMRYLAQGDASFGVGQTKMSTLAMALGWMRTIEHERVSTHESRADDISYELFKLTTDQLWELWRTLSWTKSSIFAAAKVLSFLKNRSNRYPSLTRSEFVKSTRALEIIATEYNLGATNSPETAASPTNYGNWVSGLLDNRSDSYGGAGPSLQIFTNT